MLNSISKLYLLDNNCTLPVWTTKNDSRDCAMSPREQNNSHQELLVKILSKVESLWKERLWISVLACSFFPNSVTFGRLLNLCLLSYPNCKMGCSSLCRVVLRLYPNHEALCFPSSWRLKELVNHYSLIIYHVLIELVLLPWFNDLLSVLDFTVFWFLILFFRMHSQCV